MAIVTSIEETGYNGKLVKISMDGRLVCTISKAAFRRFPLTEGALAEENEYLEQVASWQKKIAYEQALTLLDICDRSEHQVMEKLIRRGVLPLAARDAVDRLKQNGLLNDAAYAKRLVQIASMKDAGKYAVKRKLFAKGIGEDDASAALELLDEQQQSQACLDTAKRLAYKYRDEPERDARRKLSQALARRGFSWDQIENAVNSAMGADEEDWQSL